ncbi:MAG TPA: NPCBM/NEW2 domain-containing protein, partial [Planctomycetota bacterium]|nr:NPCBM/NEW2 domain-containing protein [Planctomycetota bacterium]
RPGPDSVFIRAGGKATGTINEISNKGIKLDAGKELGTQNFALKDVEAIVIGNAGAGGAPTQPKGTLVRIRCADGSSVSGAVSKFESGKLELEHTLDKLSIPSKEMLELFVLNGAFVYLSDLEPTNVEERFPDGLERQQELYGWKRDKEVVEGSRLRLGGRTYDKGLGVHSYCALTFKLNGAYKEFRTVIGLDDTTKYLSYPGVGSVTFRVLVGDEKNGMKPAKELPEGKRKKRGDAPEELSVNVEGVDQITLVADYGNYMHILGRADWADAHLVKR